MLGRDLREALHIGRRVYGTAIEGYNQPRWPPLFAQLGLDFVFIDNEHTPLNRETAAWACQAYAAHRVAPLLRIPEPKPALAAMALDAGAHGIVAPYVETVDQVKALVGAVKYRPLKGAALQTVLDQGAFPDDTTPDYLAAFNPDAVLVIMIESPAGVANLDQLLAIPGVDVVLIGPHDFTVSHGIHEQYDHPLFRRQVQHVIEVCKEHKISAGIHYISGPVERAVEWIDWGCNFVCHRSDTLFIASGIQTELGILRKTESGDSTHTTVKQLGASGHST